MVVQVMMSDGTMKSVSVRYSELIGGLFTTAAKLEERGIADTASMVAASAPFDVYKEPWTQRGWPEVDSYFAEQNKIAFVPYGPWAWGWNYI